MEHLIKNDGLIYGGEASTVAKLGHNYTEQNATILVLSGEHESDTDFLTNNRRICTCLKRVWTDTEQEPLFLLLNSGQKTTCTLSELSRLLGWFDAILADRVEHSNDQLKILQSLVSHHLLPGGYFILGTRTPKDFNPDQNNSHTESNTVFSQLTEHKHDPHFIAKSLLTDFFSEVVTNFQLVRDSELPQNPTECPVTFLTSRRRIPLLALNDFYSTSPSKEDFPWLHQQLFSKPEVVKYWMSGKCYSEAELATFIQTRFDCDDIGSGYRIIRSKYSHKRVAVIGLHAHRLNRNPYMEVSLLIAPDFQSKGIGTALLTAAGNWYSNNKIGHGLVAFVEPRNTSSHKACLRAGFTERCRIHLPGRGDRIVLLME